MHNNQVVGGTVSLGSGTPLSITSNNQDNLLVLGTLSPGSISLTTYKFESSGTRSEKQLQYRNGIETKASQQGLFKTDNLRIKDFVWVNRNNPSVDDQEKYKSRKCTIM
jgi:hypothetical protein